MDPQLAFVLVIVVAAAWYAIRSLTRQFSVVEDEAEGCATCSAAELPTAEPDSTDPAAPLVVLSKPAPD